MKSMLAASWVAMGCAGGEHAGPAVAVAVAPSIYAADRPTTQNIDRTIRYLASDELEGRGVGLPGLDQAAAFVAGAFDGIGLLPPDGQTDYFQRFDITRLNGPADSCRLAIGEHDLKLNTDFRPMSLSAEKAFGGEIVFAGYGVTDPDHGYDDYAGIDVKGKVVVALRYEPRDAVGNSRITGSAAWSRQAEFGAKARAAARHGAVGLLVVNAKQVEHDELFPIASSFMGQSASIPVLQVKRAAIDGMLTRGDVGLGKLQDEIDQNFKPASQAVAGLKVNGAAEMSRRITPVKNVVGVLAAAGGRSDEVIVIGAHDDHLGRGGMGSRSPTTNAIHNGADDNASGTAAMIEIARALAAGPPLERTIVFIAFTGEESGLLGSQFYVEHPLVPLSKTVAMINLDMVGRLRENQLIVGGTGSSSVFEQIVNAAVAGSPLKVRTAWKDGIAPSDNTSFLLKRVPTLFFFTGLHSDYHRPTDDADKINLGGEADVIAVAMKVARALSAAGKIDYIAPATTAPAGRFATSGSGGASLGVIPDYGGESVSGVIISGAVPGSPAEAAGLRDGDVLIALGTTKIETLYDLTDALAEAKPGVKTQVRFRRGNIEQTADVTLGARRAREE